MTPDRGNIINFPPGSATEPGLRFRIELLLVRYPIWRLVLVPADYSFWDLHVAIQDAMGWEDKHHHQFTLDQPGPSGRRRFGIPDPSSRSGRHEVLPGWEHLVTDFFQIDLPPALYTYDFGDKWQHEVSFDGYGPDGDPVRLPTCLAGEGMCPPEDCGGPHELARSPGDAQREMFQPETVVFANPRQRWERSFRHDS